MNALLWILQGVLAAMFVIVGVLKSVQPKEKLAGPFPWVNDYSMPVVRLVGITELAAGLGLILPGLTGIATVLTPLAAVGLAVIMVLAAIYHGRKGEWSGIGMNAVILIVSLVIAWGRFGPYAF
ncbi:DoxX family protein [Glycomyces tarimensis]